MGIQLQYLFFFFLPILKCLANKRNSNCSVDVFNIKKLTFLISVFWKFRLITSKNYRRKSENFWVCLEKHWKEVNQTFTKHTRKLKKVKLKSQIWEKKENEKKYNKKVFFLKKWLQGVSNSQLSIFWLSDNEERNSRRGSGETIE